MDDRQKKLDEWYTSPQIQEQIARQKRETANFIKDQEDLRELIDNAPVIIDYHAAYPEAAMTATDVQELFEKTLAKASEHRMMS